MRVRASFPAALLIGLSAHAHAQSAYVSADDIRVHYWGGQQRLAQSIAAAIREQTFVGLPAGILRTGDIVDLYIAPDETRFDSLTGGRAPEWGAGVAMPQRNMIVVPGYVSDRTGVHELRPIVRHELAHIALQRHLGTARIPRWFTEGYATWAADQFDEQAGWMLRLAFVSNAAPPLDSLTLDWPAREADARIAYLLSASAVRYLYSLGDAQAFTSFFEHWRDSASLEESLRRVYVLSGAQFERLWRAHVKRSYGWTQILAQSMFLWLVLTLLALGLIVVRRRRDRQRMTRLRETELPDAPAYWLEEEPGDEDAPPPEDEPPAPRA
ncbi:MAG TPA: hypothetical protein VMN60_10360 [Longimicrobiales bacterium]|nr:hypothetical protein [Longimicrobiales bacterium]